MLQGVIVAFNLLVGDRADPCIALIRFSRDTSASQKIALTILVNSPVTLPPNPKQLFELRAIQPKILQCDCEFLSFLAFASLDQKSSDIPTDMAFNASVTLPAMSIASRKFRLIPVSI